MNKSKWIRWWKSAYATLNRENVPPIRKLWAVLAASCLSSGNSSTHRSNSVGFKSVIWAPRNDSGRKHTGNTFHRSCIIGSPYERQSNKKSRSKKYINTERWVKQIHEIRHFYCNAFYLIWFMSCFIGWQRCLRSTVTCYANPKLYKFGP